LPLAETLGGLGSDYWPTASETQREDAAIHLEGANLQRTDLTLSVLRSAHLEGANLQDTFLVGVSLRNAYLGIPDSYDANPATSGDYLKGQVSFADLRKAYFDASSTLASVILGGNMHGVVRIADVRWGNVNLATVEWSQIDRLGDENVARDRRTQAGTRKNRDSRTADYREATRAYLQLSYNLRNQGIREHADRFAYRAQICQRLVLKYQRKFIRYAGSLFLDLISGYGYKPMRSVVTYVIVILSFAAMYFALTNVALAPFLPSHSSPLAWYEALVLSVSSFHGRGLFPTGLSLGDPIAILAAFEAIIGLLIEITFIATFTQRFFAR
jgi:hypothetical protein